MHEDFVSGNDENNTQKTHTHSSCDDINLQHRATNIRLTRTTGLEIRTQIERINKAVSDKSKYLQFHFSTYLSSIKNGNINISFAGKQQHTSTP